MNNIYQFISLAIYTLIFKLKGGIKMVPIKETKSYIFLDIVLSKNKPFTLRDIFNELNKKGIKIKESKIKKALDSLCDNWAITKEAYYYINYNEKHWLQSYKNYIYKNNVDIILFYYCRYAIIIM